MLTRMTNPLTESEQRSAHCLEAHGYIFDHDLDWREHFAYGASSDVARTALP